MDTILGHPINDIFHLLSRFDVLAGFAPTKIPSFDSGTPIEMFKNHCAVPRINTGVVGFSKKAVKNNFLSIWQQRLLSGLMAGKHLTRPLYGDQSEFRSTVWNTSAHVFALPVEYHLRSGGSCIIDGPVRILHGRPKGGRKCLIEFLNSSQEQRIWIAGKGMRKISDQFNSIQLYKPDAHIEGTDELRQATTV